MRDDPPVTNVKCQSIEKETEAKGNRIEVTGSEHCSSTNVSYSLFTCTYFEYIFVTKLTCLLDFVVAFYLQHLRFFAVFWLW